MRTHRLSTCITIAGVMLTLLVGVLSGNPAAWAQAGIVSLVEKAAAFIETKGKEAFPSLKSIGP